MDYIIEKKALILDFDGTICYTFKDYDLRKTVACLREAMLPFGVDFSLEKDAFDVFDEIRNQAPRECMKDAFLCADRILTEAELEAVETCELVQGVKEYLPYFAQAGYALGVATNNSAICVEKLIRKYWPDIPVVTIGRVPDKPELMKPSMWSLTECIKELDVTKDQVVFVGDTQRDYFCAQNAGCRFIGMGATERKRNRLQQKCEGVTIVTDYRELYQILDGI